LVQCFFIFHSLSLSVGQVQADKVAEEHLRILKSCNQKLVDWRLQESLVDLFFVQQLLSIDLDLNGKNLNLISGYLHLVGLAVKRKAVDGLHNSVVHVSDGDGFVHLVLSSDEGELDVGVEVTAGVLEGHLELLNSASFFNGEGDNVHACCAVVELSHAPDWRVVEVAEKKDFNLLLLLFLKDHLVRHVAEQLLSLGNDVVSESDVDVGDNPCLQLVLGSLDDNDEFLAHFGSDLDGDVLLQLLVQRVFNKPAVEVDLRVSDLLAVLVVEGQLFSIVLSESLVTVEHLCLVQVERNHLVFRSVVGQKQG